MRKAGGPERRKTPRNKARIPVARAGAAVPSVERQRAVAGSDDAGGRVATIAGVERRMNVRPDPLDFRDRMYEPTLVEVPPRSDLELFRRIRVPVLDQGSEGSCTGAALATVAHYLLRTRSVAPDDRRVSVRMFYEMAKRHDEWEGTEYSGSSARGAMKGWHKHGVCTDELWTYESGHVDRLLNEPRSREAASRPLGAYYRVDHTDLVAMHAAISEVGILYASARVHEGWDRVTDEGSIPYGAGLRELGGHAFAIVGYDHLGFWIQNSWGEKWGQSGIARFTYDDWVANGTDVWVARLGAAVSLSATESTARLQIRSSRTADSYTQEDLRPHIISIGNDGRLRSGGRYGMTSEDVTEIFDTDFPRITANWDKRRILLYAHGGLVGEDGALQRIADYRNALLENQVYPLAFIWKTDYWTTLRNMLNDAGSRRRPEAPVAGAKDFLLDRADDMLEPLARAMTGKAEWDEMKENALRSTVRTDGGTRLVLQHLRRLAADGVEIHLIGHSAGSIFHAPIVQQLTTKGEIRSGLGGFRETLDGQMGFGLQIASCTLWAPACTTKLFHDTYAPAIAAGWIRDFAIFTLTDDAEQDDDCARIYNKSLLYLVSNAFEERFRIPLLRPEGEPILGMETFLGADRVIDGWIREGRIDHVRAPNTNSPGSVESSTATTHGGFDDDVPTVRAALARILGSNAPVVSDFAPTAQSRRGQRRMLLS